jgi:hypothetical protein
LPKINHPNGLEVKRVINHCADLISMNDVCVEGKKVKPMRNVFEAILQCGHDEDFVPHESDEFVPTDAPAGSPEKLATLARRIELGVPLWHPEDRSDYSGLTGVVRPRE